jgi:4-hydroxybenzoate polyprenyltransferase
MNVDDNWIWLLTAFWLGTCIGFVAYALVKVGRVADDRRARGIRTIHADLLSDTVSRF